MLTKPKRISPRKNVALKDWLVLVVYLQKPTPVSTDAETAKPFASRSPPELQEFEGLHGLVGRDRAIQELERLMRRKASATLIQGLTGMGKTTLAKGFVQWLEHTGGLEGAFWFRLNEIMSAEAVINQRGMALFVTNFGAAPLEDRLAALAKALKDHRLVIVWDNFEDACGLPGQSVTAKLNADDQA